MSATASDRSANIDRLHAHANRAPLGFPQPVPRLGVVVLTCMDARIDTFDVLGLGPGDAHIIRNAGGMVTDDVVESIAISQHMVGTTEVMVIHHTNCLAHADRAPGYRPEQTAKWVVETLRADPRLAHRDHIRGFVLDVVGGKGLVEV
ncbi:MAG: carbonic anhydrase [Thermoleophilia bacterium]